MLHSSGLPKVGLLLVAACGAVTPLVVVDGPPRHPGIGGVVKFDLHGAPLRFELTQARRGLFGRELELSTSIRVDASAALRDCRLFVGDDDDRDGVVAAGEWREVGRAAIESRAGVTLAAIRDVRVPADVAAIHVAYRDADGHWLGEGFADDGLDCRAPRVE